MSNSYSYHFRVTAIIINPMAGLIFRAPWLYMFYTLEPFQVQWTRTSNCGEVFLFREFLGFAGAFCSVISVNSVNHSFADISDGFAKSGLGFAGAPVA